MKQRPGIVKAKAFGLCALFITVFWVAVHLLSHPMAPAEATDIAILHSNNVTGHLFACPT